MSSRIRRYGPIAMARGCLSLCALVAVLPLACAFSAPAFGPLLSRRCAGQGRGVACRQALRGILHSKSAGLQGSLKCALEQPGGRRAVLGRALRAAALAAASLDARQEAVAAEKPALQELSLGRRVDLRPAPGALDIRAPDVVYPGPMLGDWKVTRVLTDVEFPRGKSAVEANVAEGMLAR